MTTNNNRSFTSNRINLKIIHTTHFIRSSQNTGLALGHPDLITLN
jgi:hypothetical protein